MIRFLVEIKQCNANGVAAECEQMQPIRFLSASPNPDNPSDHRILRIEGGYTPSVPVRLEVPNFSIQLSENVSGMILNQSFSLNFLNHDGFFDDETKWDLFNSFVTLKKAVKDNPKYEEFVAIREGTAGNAKTSFSNFNIEVYDQLRSMSKPVCNVIKENSFDSFRVTNPDAIGKNIPVVYGTRKVKLIKLGERPGRSHYLAAEYLTNIKEVLNKDGVSVLEPGERIINEDGGRFSIRSPDADTAIVTGYCNRKIGEVIRHLTTEKLEIPFDDNNWNREEFNRYIAISPTVNIVFDSGSIRAAIQEVLKSDMAYFIQQLDGKFTIRRWGEIYNVHNIGSWQITQQPQKGFAKAEENYFSECVVGYWNVNTNDHTESRRYHPHIGESRHGKERRFDYDTNLAENYDAQALAKLLALRYTTLRQRVRVGIAMDTSGLNLLDVVVFDDHYSSESGITINGRRFSRGGVFIITEINPAQDILVLEDISDIVWDIDGRDTTYKAPGSESPGENYYRADYDEMDAKFDRNGYKFIFDGGKA